MQINSNLGPNNYYYVGNSIHECNQTSPGKFR